MFLMVEVNGTSKPELETTCKERTQGGRLVYDVKRPCARCQIYQEGSFFQRNCYFPSMAEVSTYLERMHVTATSICIKEPQRDRHIFFQKKVHVQVIVYN